MSTAAYNVQIFIRLRVLSVSEAAGLVGAVFHDVKLCNPKMLFGAGYFSRGLTHTRQRPLGTSSYMCGAPKSKGTLLMLDSD